MKRSPQPFACPGAPPVLFYRAALPLSRQTLTYVTGLIRRHRVKFMIRDRGPDFTAAFDAVLAGAGIRTVLCNVRTPRINAITERRIGGCRRELLDRALVWNQPHLRQILREYEIHHNQHRRTALCTTQHR
jgi:hypothetical protein